MEARLTTKPMEHVIAAVQALDLEPVKLRVMDAELGEGWTREHADRIEAAYRTYWMMLAKYPDDAQDIVLSKDVDHFWHAHILQTAKYAEDCQKVFGNFLHHNPHVGPRTSADVEKKSALMHKTRRLYQREFGNPQAADAAWAGGAFETGDAAYCDIAARAVRASYCDAVVRARDAAYCDAVAQAESAAYCDASLRTDAAAYCDAAVRSRKAA